jgi:choline dehydrogenase-like flavoprotein
MPSARQAGRTPASTSRWNNEYAEIAFQIGALWPSPARGFPREGLKHVEQDLLSYAKRMGTSGYHVCGTCRMGPAADPLAVVDSSLRVNAVPGLRIADASIMPSITSGNTNAPTMMIAEKAADLILSV